MRSSESAAFSRPRHHADGAAHRRRDQTIQQAIQQTMRPGHPNTNSATSESEKVPATPVVSERLPQAAWNGRAGVHFDDGLPMTAG